MDKDLPRDQAMQLRKQVKNARDEQHENVDDINVFELPSRKEKHRNTKKKKENRLHLSLPHLLLILFLFIVIAVLVGALYYFEWL